MLVDSHSHLFLEEFAEDLPFVMERARAAGVTHIFMPNIDSTTIEPMLSVCADYPDFCYPMIGLHPTSVNESYRQELSIVRERLEAPNNFVAIGEIGLDLYWDKTFLNEQLYVFEKQIEWALEYKLPIVVHSREAFDYIYKVMEPYKNTALTGIFHSFTGNAEEAARLLEFGGFKNRQQIYHKNGYTIVDDTYNASPDSMKAAIGVLSSLPAGRRIAVLADMKELGENTIQFHREVGAFLAEKPVDILVVYGELAQAIAEGAKKVKPDLHVVSFEEDEKEDMLDWLDAQIGEGDAVLFKGSNSMKLGETAARFISVEKTPTSSGGK